MTKKQLETKNVEKKYFLDETLINRIFTLTAFLVHRQQSMRILVNSMAFNNAVGPLLVQHLFLAFAVYYYRSLHTL